MSQSILSQLPKIVAHSRQTAAELLADEDNCRQVKLQTHEWLTPDNGTAPAEPMARFGDAKKNAFARSNRLICGDNLEVMAALLAGDEQNPSLRGMIDLIYIDPPFASQVNYCTKVHLPGVAPEQKTIVVEQFAYVDRWPDDTAAYLAMITPRLILMRELLSDRGSIYVHLDWHVAHYVKLVMDEVFGKANFQNEIVWHYRRWTAESHRYQSMHDKLLFYTKTDHYYFGKTHVDATKSQQAFIDKGYNVNVVNSKHGKIRQLLVYDKDKVDRLVKDEKIDLKKYDRILYVDAKGTVAPDVWTDIQFLHSRANERTSYATQKPEKLLARIIAASCPADGLVADFFGGSGTTAAVADKLGRRWISADQGKPACMVMRKRLLKQNAKAFRYECLLSTDAYEKQHKQQAQTPFPDPRHLMPTGIGNETRRQITDSDVARQDADQHFDKVSVLMRTGMRIQSVVRRVHGDREHLTVSLAGYVLPSSAAIDLANLDASSRTRLQQLISTEPLALIEYWAIDPDYAGQVFHAVWHDYRGNARGSGDPLRVLTQTTIDLLTTPGPRKLYIRAIDVFGFESTLSVFLA